MAVVYPACISLPLLCFISFYFCDPYLNLQIIVAVAIPVDSYSETS